MTEETCDEISNAGSLKDSAVRSARTGDQKDQADLVSAVRHDVSDGTLQIRTGYNCAVEYADRHCDVLGAEEFDDIQETALRKEHRTKGTEKDQQDRYQENGEGKARAHLGLAAFPGSLRFGSFDSYRYDH